MIALEMNRAAFYFALTGSHFIEAYMMSSAREKCVRGQAFRALYRTYNFNYLQEATAPCLSPFWEM
jgi:hypothetical protein